MNLRYEFSVLAPTRCGLRLAIHARARTQTGPVLWVRHGRYAESAPPRDLRVASAATRLNGVRYTAGAGEAQVRSDDGAAVTRLRWDRAWFEHLWIITVAQDLAIDLGLLLDPCASRPFRLDEAVANGASATIAPGEQRAWWIELESLDAA